MRHPLQRMLFWFIAWPQRWRLESSAKLLVHRHGNEVILQVKRHTVISAQPCSTTILTVGCSPRSSNCGCDKVPISKVRMFSGLSKCATICRLESLPKTLVHNHNHHADACREKKLYCAATPRLRTSVPPQYASSNAEFPRLRMFWRFAEVPAEQESLG